MHAVRSCLPLLRIPKAVGHFGIRGHWVKQHFSCTYKEDPRQKTSFKREYLYC